MTLKITISIIHPPCSTLSHQNPPFTAAHVHRAKLLHLGAPRRPVDFGPQGQFVEVLRIVGQGHVLPRAVGLLVKW